MAVKTAQLDLLWQGIAVGSLDSSQGWVLSAMRRYGQDLLGMLWRILGNEQDVCDAYQDTFLSLAHCLDGKKPGNIKSYLLRTASNTAISILRKKLAFDRTCQSVAKSIDSETVKDCGDLDLSALRDDLRHNIAQLPERLREVVVLRDLGELSYEKISEILQITPASARVYRCKALRLLAESMVKRSK